MSKMAWGKLAISAIAFAIIAELIFWISMTLALRYATLEEASLLMTLQNAWFPGIVIGLLIGLVLSIIYHTIKYALPNKGTQRGFYFGIMIFTVIAVCMYLPLSFLPLIPKVTLLAFMGGDLLTYLLGGMIIAAVHG